MLTTDTILACASGAGRGTRAMVRVAGPGARALGMRIFEPFPDRAGSVLRTSLRIGSGRLLPCLVLRSDGPRSYTGQDQFEIVVPGSPIVVDRVIRRVLAELGVGPIREAGPGEFSARGYLNGKLRLEQAEGVAAVIAAQTQRQLEAADDLMAGRTGTRYHAWAEELGTLLALVEAGIDFTDQEDVVPIAPGALAGRIRTLSGQIRAELGSVAGSEQRSMAARVVLAGAPNAGKSTLFNALLGRRRAVESPVAGTTRDAIEEPLDLSADVPAASGLSVVLVDLAGLDERIAQGATDREAQAVAREEIQRADVVIWCDPASRFDGVLPKLNRPVLRVRTKADLASPTPVDGDAIGVCALDGWHVGTLRRAIADAAWGAGSGGAAWLVPRHRRTLAAVLARLEAAGEVLRPQERAAAIAHVELVAGELRGGLDVLGELVGRIDPDEVIGRVFATFCVGK